LKNQIGSGKCNVCGLDSTLKCSRCGEVYYCTATHQRDDWKNHKKVCKIKVVKANDADAVAVAAPIARVAIRQNELNRGLIKASNYTPQAKIIQPNLNSRKNEKHMNEAMLSFGVDTITNILFKCFSHYKVRNVSIGSGNGLLEHEFVTKYPTLDIICVDPNPLEFISDELAKPFKVPTFKRAEELLSRDLTIQNNCVLLLNWCYPNDSTYDYDAIQILKPLAFITILEHFGNSGGAGGQKFHNFLRETDKYTCVHRISLDKQQKDLTIEWWQKVELPLPTNIDLPDIVKSLIINKEPCLIM
jgi:hypothetical protein